MLYPHLLGARRFLREKARADSVQASTGTSAAAAAAEASESAAEAANLVEMDTDTEDTQPEPEPALSSTSGQIDGETVAGATNGYGVSSDVVLMCRVFNARGKAKQCLVK